MAKIVIDKVHHDMLPKTSDETITLLLEHFKVVQNLLGTVPKVNYTREPFPYTLRILGVPRCGATCILGAAANGFCHGEGQAGVCHVNALPSVEAIEMAWQAFRPASVKLVCIETANLNSVCTIIKALRKLECKDISTTWTNEPSALEHLPVLLNAGLTRMNLSVHRFGDENRQSLESIISFIPQSQQHSIKINRVLLASTIQDLPTMIRWVLARGYRLRLFSLMRTPTATSAFDTEYVHWTSVVALLSNRLDSVYVTDYVVSNRRRYEFVYEGGGIIEANMPTVALPGRLVVVPDCRICNLKGLCEEGYLGCGVRLAPDGRFYPCLLRPELSFIPGGGVQENA